MGKRWRAEDFPKTTWNVWRWIWRPGLGLKGFYNMRPFKHVVVLCGNAVGGGSITYANTLLSPPATVWSEGSWQGLADWLSGPVLEGGKIDPHDVERLQVVDDLDEVVAICESADHRTPRAA